MFKAALIIISLAFTSGVSARSAIALGSVGKFPIELVLYATNYADTFNWGTYVYTKHNEPIELYAGRTATTLVLDEYDSTRTPSASFRINTFDPAAQLLHGTFFDLHG